MQELASAMRAGHSLVAGISAMAQAPIEPSRGEWGRVLADEQLGMPLKNAMRTLAPDGSYRVSVQTPQAGAGTIAFDRPSAENRPLIRCA
jgi:hypothetical protein